MITFNNKKDNLFLFTISYPYDFADEISFLQNEISYLASAYNTYIIPLENKGNKAKISKSVVLEEGLAQFLNEQKKMFILKALINSLISKWFYLELLNNPSVLMKPRKLIKLILYFFRARLIYKWIKLFVVLNGLTHKKNIFYTYWFTEATTACSWFANIENNYRLVSRAHGIDIYEDQHDGYIPFRLLTLSRIDSLCLVSNHALNYISDKYSIYKLKFHMFGLGVKDPGFITQKSKDNCFRIVSCSNIISIKRIDLLLEGIIDFARKYNNQIYWYHIGDGSLKYELVARIKALNISNLRCILIGRIDNLHVMEFYHLNPIDLFITTSSTEGGRPVSIQEAQSCGIPAIGTNVGGIPEIVKNNTGILLSSDPSPFEIGNAILSLAENKNLLINYSMGARLNWKNNFNEAINFKEFINHLKTL